MWSPPDPNPKLPKRQQYGFHSEISRKYNVFQLYVEKYMKIH